MKLKIKEAELISNKILGNLGFYKEIAELTTKNLIEAELCGKKAHGLQKLLTIKKVLETKQPKILDYLDYIDLELPNFSIISESISHIYINGNYKPGFYLLYKSLELSFRKIRKSKLVVVGIKDVGFASGFIGAYARECASRDLIFIGFNNSSGGLVPHGAKKDPWGTNPITAGIPTHNLPIIIDTALSKITWNDLLSFRRKGLSLPIDSALDADGNPTTDPHKGGVGGLLPIGGRKGSALAFMVELLAGALTGSRCGCNVKGGWGSFYILFDPTLFRSLKEFKTDVQIAIDELKTLPRAEGVKELFYPGEQSGKLRKKHLEQGWFEFDDSLWHDLHLLLPTER